MRFKRVFKALGPVVALAIAGGLAGCDNADIRLGGKEGVPLSELDLSGEAPSEVILLGPDVVDIRDGERLAIEVEGSDEARARMRFVLEDGSLGILREKSNRNESGIATVIITMPAPGKLTIAGSGMMTAASVSDTPDINVLGSGTLDLPSVSAGKIDVNIAGSGTLRAAGTADTLDLNVMGSGSADLARLKVANADINVAGSGDAVFASDGEVNANIMGSGDITVRGSARCRVKTMGSGTLTCERAPEDYDEAA
jgi:hypothetical protein